MRENDNISFFQIRRECSLKSVNGFPACRNTSLPWYSIKLNCNCWYLHSILEHLFKLSLLLLPLFFLLMFFDVALNAILKMGFKLELTWFQYRSHLLQTIIIQKWIVIFQMAQTNYGRSYNWGGVLEFLHLQYEKTNQKQNMWILEKKALQVRIAELEGQLKAANLIASDLMKRNKMLQFCLRQEKSKAGKELEMEEIGLDLPPIPQRKPRSNKSNLSKILTSLGMKDIFEDIQRQVNLNTVDSSVKHLNFEKEIKLIANNEPSQSVFINVPYKPIQTLSGHNDGVRDIYFFQNSPTMVSVSQDCLMKVWNTKEFGGSDLTSSATIRSHAGSIFTITGNDDLLFTGGIEGVIRAWTIPHKADSNANKYLKGSWVNGNKDETMEPIWQLLYDNNNKQLYATTSDDVVKMYQIFQKKESQTVYQVASKVLQTYRSQSKNPRHMSSDEIISSICFPTFRSNVFAVGYLKAHEIVMFDKESAKIVNTLKFNAVEASMNKMVSFPSFIASAHQDRYVRIFDNSKMTHSFLAHNDSVSSVVMLSNGLQMITSSHDGTIKQWDIRKWSCVTQNKSHLTKQDESIHCLAAHKSKMIAASGGADALIKIYSPNIEK